MKRLLLLFSLIFLLKSGFSQGYPLVQNLGSDSTLIRIGPNYNGAIKGRLVNMTVTDTVAANLLRIKDYPFAQIATTSDSSIWFRYNNMWIKLAGSQGGASGNFWSKTGDLFPVIPSGFGIGTNDATNLPFKTNGTTRLILPSGGIVRSAGAANKYLTYDTITNTLYYGDGATGAGITQLTGDVAAGPGSGSQAATLANTAVTPGSYTNTNLTVDSKGRITAASNGSGGSGSYSLAADSLMGWGLEFDWTLQSRVDVGELYPVGLSYGKCFWEYWINPYDGNGAGYLISSDYGGAHSNLFGLQDDTDSTTNLTGNFYPGTGTLADYTFTSSSAMLMNRVHHVAMMFDSTQVILYTDGVPVGHKSGYFTRNTAGYGGTGKTYIGGSDHNNYNGIIYKYRGFEDYTPVTAEYFTPAKDFLPGVAGEVMNMDFTRPAQQLNNQGVGFLGEKGNGARTAQSIIATQFTGSVNDSNRLGDSWLSQFIKSDMRTKPAYTGLASTIPGSAKVYMGFNSQDIVPAWDVLLRIDSTEGGTLGKKKINLEAGNAFGIINKNLWMYVGGGAYPIISVNVNDSIQDVRLEHTTGEAYFVANVRYTDGNNRIEVVCHPNGTTYVTKYVAGTPTSLGTYTTPTFATLRVTTTATTVSVYTDATLQVNAASTSGITGGLKFGVGVATPYTRIDTFSMY